MSGAGGIPRISLVWLLVAQLLVLAPFLTQLPVWLAALWLGCAAWRVQIFRMRATFPTARIKLVLLLGSAGGVYLFSGGRIGMEVASALLIAAFILKLVEMHSRRDALIVIYLGFFAVVTGYLFQSSMFAALYSLLPVTALLAALIGLHEGDGERPWATLRLAGSLLLQALPLMLLLFVFFPRLGPIWSLPQASQQGVTGLSDRMAPGDIVELGRSDALVFRARFEGAVPARDQLYWRALTLDQFDGREWSKTPSGFSAAAEPAWSKRGEALQYSIVMQPSGKPWLFALDVPQSPLPRVRMYEDFRLEHYRPVEQSLLYDVTSWPAALREPTLSPAMQQRTLQLPLSGNPQTRAWAEQLRRDHPDPAALVEALLVHFNREPYGYTLRPPPVGVHIIDDFLFASRQGFCLHFAGAMTFVLRAAGIPARMVAGYHGGEYNAAGNYLAVRQFDAHAWVEYWRPGQGWLSIDPTFQVAPERIEYGLEEALAEEQSFLEDAPLSLLRYRDVGWLNGLRLNWDRANYGWQRWVLGYQAELQLRLLQRWLGGFELRQIGWPLLGGGALLLGLLALGLFKPWQRKADVSLRLLTRFERLLARWGVARQPGEGVRTYAQRAAAALPEQAEAILAFMAVFEAQRYAGEQVAVDQMRMALRRVRRSLPWHVGAGRREWRRKNHGVL
ncbi:DUF3488 and transglutaminase-like domain-containing protein [Pseudomonas sp.]|jgi:transglutaminase-like putative cysteine protease|uniref:transglutaminase TgpA family protein n=1 Tax=Pseudomonas sp. TaxID=306 RepID=UPI0019F52C77|nr:DUF3488 and transglutaminase-like domain-containing protein [Pseudomonas sp.]MBF0673942.1 DUF3488 domain-containing transglutaminase family protein [Pseudomonas sp.]